MYLLAALLVLQGPAPGTLTLEQALARARVDRGTVAAAGARVAAARAALRVAGTVPNPTVTYSHSQSTPREHLLVDQSLDWLLRRGSDRQAGRFGIGSAEADSSLTAAEQDREVRVAYYTARATVVAESLSLAQAALSDTVARISNLRLRAGDISLLEAEQARADAARSRQNVSAMRESARMALSDLSRAVGLEPAAPPLPVDRLDAGLDSVSILPVALEQTPAVRAAVADSGSAAALARSASLAAIPLPTIQGGAEWDDPTQPGTLAVIGVAIPIPLWNHGAGNAAQARARVLEAAANAREARLTASHRIAATRIRLVETGVRARFARDTLLPVTRSLRQRALHAFQAGETGILPVLDALRSERDAVLAAMQDLLAFQTALADWRTLGDYGR